MSELKIPSIGEYVRHIGTLIKIETIQPKPPPKPEVDYIFEEIDARCELRLGDEVIKELDSLNDFYGLESSVKTAIEEMKEYAKSRKLTKDSELEVVVIRIATQIRKRPLDRDSIYNKGYRDFDSLGDYRSTIGLPEPVETIVWSSKSEQNNT